MNTNTTLKVFLVFSLLFNVASILIGQKWADTYYELVVEHIVLLKECKAK